MIGIKIRCSEQHCGRPLSNIDDFTNRNHREQLNTDLGKVTDDFFGLGNGQVQIETFEDLDKLSSLHLICNNCQNEDKLNELKKKMREKFTNLRNNLADRIPTEN
ncbi:hypothetical protein [Cytobacillus gottheilii]|uniref:hypothetical protein n=1 Tax=Cytobacillus gottheilii TaxID=859144 RepID=UPI00082AFFAF|nr:hypothetical protein [Cytobacillus gottheilii]